MLSGPALDDARAAYEDQLEPWSQLIDVISPYTADDLRNRLGRSPTIAEVIAAVEKWKSTRKPKVTRDDIFQAIVNLGTRGWLAVEPDSTTEQAVNEMVVAGSLAD